MTEGSYNSLPPTRVESEGLLERAVARLTHCATFDPAHFGGPHGMFVDVPVRDLQVVLSALAEHVRKADAVRAGTETHIDRECQVLGHEFATEHEDEPMTCIHCGAEYADA